MGKTPRQETRSVVCPMELRNDQIDKPTFVQMDPYTESFQELQLTDDEQRGVEASLMLNPIQAPIIEGTGGIRATHFALPTDSRGALHLTVHYAYYPEAGHIILADIWLTEEVDELTQLECARLKQLYEEVQRYLDA